MFMISRLPVRRACCEASTPGVHRMPTSSHAHHTTTQSGFTLVEMLIATALAGLLIAGLNGVIGQALTIQDSVSEKNDLTQQARFAMEQMVRVAGHSRLLLLPLSDNPSTNWRENMREQTVPASLPEGSSTRATAVLAVTLPLYFDLDADGYADADDDRDGRIDEDLPANRTYSQSPGIYLIDDDGDGAVDEGSANDDDESSTGNEDLVNGIDDDADNSVDEDPPPDMNADGCSGICGVDDDNDNLIDEAAVEDDDEDGQSNEDWLNAVVFYLDNGTLIQRTPVPWDENASGGISGKDFIVEPIAGNVTRFRVERLLSAGGRAQLIDLTLELNSPVSGVSVSLHTQARLGGAL